MTVINNKNISGITSINAQSNSLELFNSAGVSLLDLNTNSVTFPGNISGVGGTLTSNGDIQFDSNNKSIKFVAGNTATNTIESISGSGPRASIDFVGSGTVQVTDIVFKTSETSSTTAERMRIKTSTGNIGIGTDDPSRKLSVNGVIESLGEVSVGSTSEGGQLMLRAPSQQLSGTKYRYSMDVSYGNTTFSRPVGSEVNGIRFLREDDSDGANGIVLASIGQDGIMSLPYLPCFRARHNNNTLVTGTLVYNLVDTNIGSHYNGTNGRFTAPITGFYSFKAHTLIQNAPAGEARMALYKNGGASDLGAQSIYYKDASQWQTIHISADLYLSAGDYITVEMVQNPSTTYSDSNFNGFCGFLVG